MILDVFFDIAIPLVVVGVVVAKLVLSRVGPQGIYATDKEKKTRDAINQQYRTNRGAAVIAGIFVLIYVFIVFALIEQWGAIFFTFVISVLMLLPVATVCGVVIMFYTFSVHAWANSKSAK
ncbi:MAG: hypothetical protein AAF387_21935 [Pseudomonadota bacterium]